MINTNLPPILHRFRDIAFDRSKIAIHCVPKNVTPLHLAIIFYIHSSIATIFGTNVAEKVGNQNVLYFPTTGSVSPGSASALPGETGNPEIVSFHLNAACFFTKTHETQLTRWLYCVERPQYSTRRRSASDTHRSGRLCYVKTGL